jgi:hypothetical protein
VNAVDAGPSNNGRGFEPWGWTHLHVDRLSPSYCRVTTQDRGKAIDSPRANYIILIDLVQYMA